MKERGRETMSDKIKYTEDDILLCQLAGDDLRLFPTVLGVGVTDEGAVFLHNMDGGIMKRDEWVRLCKRVEAFYRQYTDADIDDVRRESERRKRAKYESIQCASEKVRKAKPGFVYLLRCGEFYKIGRAKKWVDRVATFQTIYPHDLEVIHVARCDDMKAEEEALHKAYADRRDKGEWFRLTPDDVAAIVSAMPEKVAP